MTGTDASEMICDGGRPLWPVRWNLWRHGTWKYTVTAVGPDGSPLPGAAVEIGPVEGGFSWAWYRPLSGRPARLCIDGREYHRRQQARKKRRR